MILSNAVIYNKYGIACVLREDSDMYFLSSELTGNDSTSLYYTVNPVVTVVKTVAHPTADVRNVITKTYSSTTIEEVLYNIRNLSLTQKQWLFEGNMLLEQPNKLINQYFFGYYWTPRDGVLYSWYLNADGIYRKKIGGDWSDCDNRDIKLIETHISTREATVTAKAKDMGLGFYGLVNYDDVNFASLFCIKKLPDEKEIKKNRLPRGRICSTTPSGELTAMLEQIKMVDDDDLKEKKKLCLTIFKFLLANNLLLRDSSCGQQQ